MRRLLALAAILASIGAGVMFASPVSMGQALQGVVAGGPGAPPPSYTGLIDCVDCGNITPVVFWGARAPSAAMIGANSFDVGCNATATTSVQFTAVYAANGYHDASFAANACASTRWLIKAYDSSGSVLCAGAACAGTPPVATSHTPTFTQNAHGHWCMAFNGNAGGVGQDIANLTGVTASGKAGMAGWARRVTGTVTQYMPYTGGNVQGRFTNAVANEFTFAGSATTLTKTASDAAEHSIIFTNSQDTNSFLKVDGGTAAAGSVGSGTIATGGTPYIGYLNNLIGTGIVCEFAYYIGATAGTHVPSQAQANAMNTNQAAAW